MEVEPQSTLGWRWNLSVPLGGGGTSEYPWVEVEPQCTPGWRWTEEERVEERCITRDGDDVEQPPHGLGADVAEPVLGHQQLGEVEGHLAR